ncbi:alanine--tRNA ligase [Alloalcanivorax xenomutans]|uniref:Alanine--tRNA ligase n=1 Tax=Alloalcanivorax xenomutans TaxID=1094342 RepID=A0A9Q3W5B8_9GAMM|nr:alanine--tRNA ligase [Alloalcanivorax xenomutans]ARB46440.1 alanyl-tRNA synthetase [Alloalcanivorax xenomutans]MCE7510815.1 alanine--tRNA ligase [Alloalcanivorax xenomutans]MCE7525938.1 alanine--tRNA ligase [Alloalcanivorax xenomutans]WOA30127.1 alanine--tRNA ligase [Alloalcanivorax xenomutans]WOD27074.1 alanine--tRNA ligase [Alloalcanivorax xenomutans]
MKSAEIRQAFLDYFASQGHTVVPSSSLVPENDPTLLFTNAGMNQFKDVFLGREKRDYTRATSSQRCVRAGGKHNDLENVGYTARHHTFFEMLGNFSFGDYFKREAIRFAWEFLTGTLGLPEERLWVTVHVSDDEAADIWLKEMGVSAERFSRLDEDNFWQMGDTGPCGPCSEIFYDHGEDVPGGPPGSENDDLDRYIEIWNLVFMQYDRQPDGELQPLPKPSVDTGMGLERIAAVMQGVHSNYEIDLFQALLKAAAEATGCQNLEEKSLRVIADHIRSASFLICDGVIPSNEGRGYVLRRIIRRALRHGHKLGQDKPFFSTLVKALVAQMGQAYPELVREQARIEKALLTEEEQFARTLNAGMKVLENAIAGLQGSELPGDVVFALYDTHGFPPDLTADVARERGLTVDMAGFEKEMEAQRALARGTGAFANDYSDRLTIESVTDFSGYEKLADQDEIVGLYKDGNAVNSLNAGDEGMVVLARTPFYAESGGQVGDTGLLVKGDSRFAVADTKKRQSAHVHLGTLEAGTLKVGDKVDAYVDVERRNDIMRNHSATHLMHAALRQVLGGHVQQKGSLVAPDYLRFDFSHGEALSAEQREQIETIVNRQILANTAVSTELMDIDAAREAGAMALFGEKYDDQVRVLTMGRDGFSKELCGGTHVSRTGDIGLFKITLETSAAAGVRRIEAVTGEGALALVRQHEAALAEIAGTLKSSPELAAERVGAQARRVRELEKEVERLKQKLASGAGGDLTADAREVAGVKVLATQVDGADAKTLRVTMDKVKDKLGSAVILLAAVEGDKVALVAGVTKDLTDRFKAGDLMRQVAGQLDGRGGGRPDMAQGGGNDVAALPKALAGVYDWVAEQA